MRARFGDWEISLLVPQVKICRLHMDRNRIVNARADAPAEEMFLQRIALFGANHVEMPY